MFSCVQKLKQTLTQNSAQQQQQQPSQQQQQSVFNSNMQVMTEAVDRVTVSTVILVGCFGLEGNGLFAVPLVWTSGISCSGFMASFFPLACVLCQCYTCRPLGGQHGSRFSYPHTLYTCFFLIRWILRVKNRFYVTFGMTFDVVEIRIKILYNLPMHVC